MGVGDARATHDGAGRVTVLAFSPSSVHDRLPLHHYGGTMRRAVLLCLPALLLVGCGGDPEQTSTTGASPTSTSPAAPTATYAELFIDEYTETFGEQSNTTGGTGTTDDWQAFAQTLNNLEPPSGSEGEHNRAVAAFEAYAETRADYDSSCDTSPQANECYGLALDVSQAWQAALDSSYELPGISGP